MCGNDANNFPAPTANDTLGLILQGIQRPRELFLRFDACLSAKLRGEMRLFVHIKTCFRFLLALWLTGLNSHHRTESAKLKIVL